MNPGSDFSAEQQLIVEQPVDARALVNAAAGTGKTHVLMGRITTLVERDALCAGDDLLVVSFSRAAVAELRRRAALLGSDARYVGTSTFDSLASRMLGAVDPEGAWVTQDYDSRIRAASDALSKGAEWPELALVRHILIDEMQDLVGARADLVKALLSRANCGFTILGDPAQAIYDYQEGVAAGNSSSALYKWLVDTYRDSLVRFTLTHNYRAESQAAVDVGALGERLRAEQPDQAAISSAIRTVILGLPVATPVTARRMLTRSDGASAVLLRTNGDALSVSRALSDAGIPHRLQRRGDDKAAAGWLSEAVAGLDTLRVTRSALIGRLEAIADRDQLDSGVCCRLMRLLDPRRGDEFDLRRIADRIRMGDIPEELNAVAPSIVVVSTIHRAKGLEFDRVMIGDILADGQSDDPGLENRIAYVALSRARNEIWSLDVPRSAGLRIDGSTRRWVRRGFGSDRWKTYDLEVLGTDVHGLHPAGSWLIDADVFDTQTYIRTNVRPGDPVDLVLAKTTEAGELAAYYGVYHGGRPVGVTSAAFGTTLHRVLGGKASLRWPTRIDAARVEVVDTVAGHESVGKATGLGAHGLWARVRISGLGVLSFDQSSEGS